MRGRFFMKTIIFGLGKSKKNRQSFIPRAQLKKISPDLLPINELRNNAKKNPVKLNKMLSVQETLTITEKVYPYLKTKEAFSHKNLIDIKKQIRLDKNQYKWVLSKLKGCDFNTGVKISMWCLKKK